MTAETGIDFDALDWTDRSTPPPHGEPVLAEHRAWNRDDGELMHHTVWWWNGEYRIYPVMDGVAYCDRWTPLPSAKAADHAR